MNNQKKLAPVIIALIVGILLIGGIFAWQYFGVPREETKAPEEVIKDETADWKTYRNEEFGFEIKYPPDFAIFEEEYRKFVARFGFFKRGFRADLNGEGRIHHGLELNIYISKEYGLNFFLNEAALPLDLSPEQALQLRIEKDKKEGWDPKEIQVGPYKGIEAKPVGIYLTEFSKYIYLAGSENIYSFWIEEDDPYIEEVKKILSTFRFLE